MGRRVSRTTVPDLHVIHPWRYGKSVVLAELTVEGSGD